MTGIEDVQQHLVTQLQRGGGDLRLELGLPEWFSSIPGWGIVDVAAETAHLQIKRITEFGFEARLKEGTKTRTASCSLPAGDLAERFWLRFGWSTTKILFQTWPVAVGDEPPAGPCPCGSRNAFVRCHAAPRRVYLPQAWRDVDVGRRRAAVDELVRIVGEDWVRSETSRISERAAANRSGGRTPDPPAQPLATLFHRVLGGDPVRLTHDLARLSLLARDVRVLSKTSVQGLEPRLSALRSTDREKVHSTIMELGVGAAAVRAGLSLVFLDEDGADGEKTPDLLIEGVECECKKKFPLARRDIRNRDLWVFLKRRAAKIFDSWSGSWRLEYWSREDPERSSINSLLGRLGGMDAPTEVIEHREEGLHWILAPMDEPKGRDSGLGGGIPENQYPPDFESFEITALAHRQDLSAGRALSFSFSTDQDSDRVQSMVNSLHKAKRQFSGEHPGCIVLEMTPTERAIRTSDLARLPVRFDQYLKGNTSIGAVLVTYDLWNQEHVRRRQSLAVRNASAVHRVPTDFDLGFLLEAG